MTNSCGELEVLLEQLTTRIISLEKQLGSKLDRGEEKRIVSTAREQTVAVLSPEIAIAANLAYAAQGAIAALKVKQVAIAATAATALGTAGKALGAIAAAATKIAGLAAAVAGLAAAVAAVYVLGNRIDRLESRVDSMDRGIGQAISIASAAKNGAETAKRMAKDAMAGIGQAMGIANNALGTANTANKTANAASATAGQSLGTANNALGTANTANKTANAASATAGQSLGTANNALGEAKTANRTANAASSTAGQALGTANNALSTANTANKRIGKVESTAGNALATAQAVQGELPNIRKRTDEAIRISTGANAMASNAINIANQALKAKAQAGPRGPAGVRGAVGATGVAGKDGKDGINGRNGINGINGRDGKDASEAQFASLAKATALQTATSVAKATTQSMINQAGKVDKADVKKLENLIRANPAQTTLLTAAALTPTLQNIQASQGATAGAINSIQANLNNLKNNMEKSFKKVMGGIDFMKIIDVLTLITSFHNALMLSRSIGETLIQVVENGLQMFGIKATENGEDLTVSKVLGRKFEDAMKATFGASQWSQIVSTWKGLNNIYTSAANIAWNVRSMMDSSLSIMSWTAENTGKIGNALKRFGVVGEKAYGRMPEQVNGMNAFQQRLENLEDAASGLEMVSSEVLSIQQNLNELQEQRQKFAKSIEEFPPLNRPDNEPVKAREEAEKSASTGAEIIASAFDPDPED